MKLTKIQGNFTQVSNTVLNDKYLSFKAKGVYAYLYSKPDGWDFSGERICKDSKDGRKAVYSALKELEHAGYLQRKKDSSGKIGYIIGIEPVAQKGHLDKKPVAHFGKEPKRQRAQTGSISNTVYKSNKEKKVIKRNSFEKTQKRPYFMGKRMSDDLKWVIFGQGDLRKFAGKNEDIQWK